LIGRLAAGLNGEVGPVGADQESTAILAAPAAAGAGAAAPPPAAPPIAAADDAKPRSRGGWTRRRTAAVASIAAVAGAVIAVFAIGSGDDSDPVIRVKTQTNTVTTEPKAPPEPEPLTGAALGKSLNDQGKALIDSGSYAEAIPILQRAVEAFPAGTSDINYAYALFNLGNALREAGRPEEAIPILEQRLQIPNQTGVVANELALAQQEAGVTSSGGVSPDSGEGEEASGSGGLTFDKPGNGPKPGKGPEGDDD
jgi:tetratricopeptide (TPR) repeat protein